MLWPFIAPAVVLKQCFNDFQNQGLFFKNCNLQTAMKRSLPKKFELFYWILGLMHPTITSKLKSSETRFFKTVLSPKLWFCHFCPKNLRITGKSIQFAAKAGLMNRQKNLMIFNFTIFPSNLKNTNKNLCVFKWFQYKCHGKLLIHILKCTFLMQ